MKNRLWITVAVAVACLGALGVDVSAGTMKIATTVYSESTGAGRGGEFRVWEFSAHYATPDSKITSPTGADFHTFCVELTENVFGIINFDVSKQAIDGGAGGGSPDPLSEATAKLFYTWWTDSWSAVSSSLDYNYAGTGGTGGTRTEDAEDMQLAIWLLENEITQDQLTTNDNGKAQDFVDLVTGVGAISWTDLGKSGWAEVGNVRVLNTYDSSSNKKQDQLIVVPLPAAGLLGLALLCGMGMVVRRRRKN